jgi:uncharacterized cupin superfamily protein
MHVPPGGGPLRTVTTSRRCSPVLKGDVRLNLRGQSHVARAGETVNVPANAPHSFRNASDRPARLLCMCIPPEQEEFFTAVGSPVGSRTEPPPPFDQNAQAAFIAKSKALAPAYRTELRLP